MICFTFRGCLVRARIMGSLAAIAISQLSGGFAEAQNTSTFRRVEIVLAGGYTLSESSSKDLEWGMRQGDLDGDPCGNFGELFCSMPDMPYSDFDRLGFLMSASYYLTPTFGLEFLLAKAGLGSTEGYYDGGQGGTLSTDADLRISSKNVWTIGCLAEIKPLPVLGL